MFLSFHKLMFSWTSDQMVSAHDLLIGLYFNIEITNSCMPNLFLIVCDDIAPAIAILAVADPGHWLEKSYKKQIGYQLPGGLFRRT